MDDSDSDGVYEWQQVRHYLDHSGHSAVLEQYVAGDWEPDPDHLVPIQVYSMVPLDPDHTRLRDYLLHVFGNDELKPRLEIYSYCPPDSFACVEHSRREIAFRKQQHRSGAANPPLLIPQFFRGEDEPPVGRCVLLRSHSYRLGRRNNPVHLDAAGEGPDAEEIQRMVSTEDVVLPEAFELSFERVTDQRDFGEIIVQDIFLNATAPSNKAPAPVPAAAPTRLRFALDVDEGTAPDPTDMQGDEDQVREHLSQQTAVGGFALDASFRVEHDADLGTVTVTNVPTGAEPDLQYLIFASFLSHLPETAAPALLASTARLFTAALLSHLPAPTTKTVTFHFAIPDSPSWSAIQAAHDKLLAAQEPHFRVGALHTFAADPQGSDGHAAAPQRVAPQSPEESVHAAREALRAPYRVFAVVLDRATFVSDAGIYFYISGYSVPDERLAYMEPHPADTEIRRSPGIAEAARRLAMLVVEEEQADKDE
ncbi:hypothetical protein BJX61DRAFT_535234 [Aspergillus egyptiacus]|nr:hypothetical protein BJX61DRAFT_535234 [Aspergillus egyptiacus]